MTIGLIGAMDEEVQLLKEKMDSREDVTIAGIEFFTGKIAGKDVVLLKSGIGKVNAAMGTAVLLDRFKPQCIINTGSAGGFYEKLNVGDIVISSEVRHHDVDVTAFNYEYGQVPGMPASFTPDLELVNVAQSCARKINDITVVTGLIATGDSFMSDHTRVEYVREKFPNLYAAEMEAAAIAQVCHQFETPFVIIRSLSDIAGKESHVSFDQFLEKAALHSASLIISMLEAL
jgi:adenosylhomocysteine nucleosidase